MDQLARQLDAAVSLVDPRLCWELGQASGEWLLVVTANGDPHVRSTAERLRRAAPPPDPGWRFYCYRPPDPDALAGQLQLGDRTVNLGDIRFVIDRDFDRARIHVTVCHPVFSGLDEDARLQAIFVALDRTLGEDEVIRWIGDIDTSTRLGANAVPAAGLISQVQALASAYGTPKSVTLRDTTAWGLPVVTRTTVPLRPIDFPLYDQHIAITADYDSAGPDQLPEVSALTNLQQIEAAMLAQVAGRAVHAGHETHDRQRVFHFYTDPATDTAQRLGSSLPTSLDGRISLEVTIDPGWDEISQFLS